MPAKALTAIFKIIGALFLMFSRPISPFKYFLNHALHKQLLPVQAIEIWYTLLSAP